MRDRDASAGRRSVGRIFLLLAAMAALSTTASCGRPGEGSSEPQNGSARIVLGELSSAASHTPIYVALQEGFFKKHGLDVSLQQLSGGTPTAMAAFSTGSVNVLNASAAEFIEYAAKRVISGRIIAENADATFDIVAVKGITRIEQLKGKTIGISSQNGADQIYFEAVLRQSGMSPSDVSYVTSGGPANRMTALTINAVQAIAASNANREMASKIGVVLLASNDSPVQIPGGLYFASDDLIANHRDELVRFVAALREATAWTKANQPAAAALCANGTGLTLETCTKGIAALADPQLNNKYTWSSTGAVNTAGVQAALDIEAVLNADTKALTLSDLVDTSFAGTTP